MLDPKRIRRRIMEMAHAKFPAPAHIGSALSCVDILCECYSVPSARVILSKGHACLALYACLEELGFHPDISWGHPVMDRANGIEFSTGSLGHGVGYGIGLALANPTQKIFVIVGDGECDEGSIWEAAAIIEEQAIKNIRVIIDCNSWQQTKRPALGKVFPGCFEFRMTTKGKGFSLARDNNDWHHKPLSKEHYELFLREND